MAKNAPKPSAQKPPGTPGWYRGVKLAPLVSPPRTSPEILDRAIEAAFGKYAGKSVSQK